MAGEVRDGGEDERAFAAAVARGEPSAVARFEREYIAPLGRVLASMRLDAATLDDVRQRVRAKLLVPGDDGEVRLVRYAGQGRLAGLVNVTATRVALDVVRAAKHPARPAGGDDDALLELADDAGDPALAGLRRRAQDAFRAAFERAVDALDARDRNLLRLHLLRGVTLDKLAEMYGVHRATVVRWIAAARASLLAETRKGLQASLGVPAAELDAVMGLIESRLDASVERLFRTRHDDDDDDDGDTGA